MRRIRIIMGMPVAVEIVDNWANQGTFNKIFTYFKYIDSKFSVFRKSSEMTLINEGKLKESEFSADMKAVLKLADKTKAETGGYFDINYRGRSDPSGLVKGWAVYKAARLLKTWGYKNFYIDAGGDVQVFGKNHEGRNWLVGIKNPFNLAEIVKVLSVDDKGVATSGNYYRGFHVYNPKNKTTRNSAIVSLTVVGSNIYDADRFATAAYAMGEDGIGFIESLPGFEGYMIKGDGIARYTTHFENYILA